MARLIPVAPEMYRLVLQYRYDLLHPVMDSGSLRRRFDAIAVVLEKVAASHKKTAS